MTINYGHRGASGYYPENTMIAFEKAFEMGANGIETDVQMTKDGVLVLIHDEMVNRTTESVGFVKDYNYLELSKLDAGTWFSKEYGGVRIPTLEELLLFVLDKKLILNLEVKTGVIQYNGIEDKIIGLLYKYNMQSRVILSSFNHYSMVRCKQISSEIKTGLLYMEGLYKPEKYAEYVGADAIHPYFYALNDKVAKAARGEGLMVNTFTVNDENYMKHFLNLKIDGIITNYPDKLQNLMNEYK